MRKPKIKQLIFAGILALLVVLGGAHLRAAATDDPNDVARFLAGMTPAANSALTVHTKDDDWKVHSSEMGSAWAAIDHRQLSRIRSWAGGKLRLRRATMFYMFGGPDFAHADAFFPDATTYVLSGLEPVGRLPAPSELHGPALAAALASLRQSFTNYQKYGYFITREMDAQFRAGQFTGTLPILYVILARSGKTISSVEYVGINSQGRAVRGGTVTGVRITYAGRDETPRTLYYFRTNLANSGVAASNFLTFCEGLGEGVSLVKSASYLMHQANFSRVRSFLLANSATLVQDDTGIPFKYFEPTAWRLRAFGQYLGPTDEFKDAYQPDLAKFFETGGAQPVRFGIGYRWHPTRTNILVAERRSGN